MKSNLPSVHLVCVVLLLLTGRCMAANARPNVLFIVCDDLNTHLSTSGYPHIQTPAFDRLAAAGMTFRRAYCQYPVCGPSWASFLSGLYPQSTGVLSNSADIRQTRPGTVSMPQRFRDAGYWTARVGKIFHTSVMNPDEAWDRNPERFQNDELPMVAIARKKFEAEHGPIDNPRLRKAWKERSTTLGTQVRGQKKPASGKQVAYTVVKRGKDLGKAIRMDRWRYAKWSDGEELYDLRSDPRETKNLARSEQHSATLQTLRAKLAETDVRAKSERR